MARRIFLKQVDPDNVSVVFKFDWNVINALRVIKSRRYVPETKENIIANKDIKELRDVLPDYDIIESSDKVKKYTITIKDDTFTVYPEPRIVDPKMSRILWLKRPRDGYELYRILKERNYDVELRDNLTGGEVIFPKAPILYEFQETGMEFLRNNDYTGLLSLDMGLGKTIMALKSIEELQKSPVLIVAQTSLLMQWKEEIERHFGYDKAKIITSKTKKADREEAFNEGDILITNYELLRTINLNRHFELLILDECQKVKNWRTKVAQAIGQIVAKRVMGLSGTPVENTIMELYNITDQIKPAYFGTQRAFFRDHVKSQYGNRFTYKDLDKVYKRLEPLMYRVEKEEVQSQLPELIRKRYNVPLTTKEEKFYWEMLAEQESILGAISNAKVFASSSALRMDIKVSSKEKELLGLLDDLQERVVVFSQYKKEVARLETLINRNVYSISGEISKDGRNEAIKEFLLDDEGVLLMTEVGTHGLNLQKARVLINMDLPWTYARLAQRFGRVQRLGSEHQSNLVVNLISAGTIDERVLEIIDEKKELMDLSIKGAKGYVAKAFAGDLASRGIYFELDDMDEKNEQKKDKDVVIPEAIREEAS